VRRTTRRTIGIRCVPVATSQRWQSGSRKQHRPARGRTARRCGGSTTETLGLTGASNGPRNSYEDNRHANNGDGGNVGVQLPDLHPYHLAERRGPLRSLYAPRQGIVDYWQSPDGIRGDPWLTHGEAGGVNQRDPHLLRVLGGDVLPWADSLECDPVVAARQVEDEQDCRDAAPDSSERLHGTLLRSLHRR
jgi:hypothetical protein